MGLEIIIAVVLNIAGINSVKFNENTPPPPEKFKFIEFTE